MMVNAAEPNADVTHRQERVDRFSFRSSFSLKDFLIYIPAAGSAIALSWEVGSFLPIGSHGFMLFSLTEHLQFAIQALPVAMVIAILTVTTLLGGAVLRGRLRQVSSSADDRVKLRALHYRIRTMLRVMKWLMLALFLSGLISIIIGYRFRDVTALVLGSTSVVAMVAGSRLRISDLPHMLLPGGVALFVFVLVMAFAVGVDQTRFNLNGGQTVTFSSASGVKEATLLRAGERGALLFDSRKQLFYFEKWEVLADLNWPRRSILQRKF
jgi:hypothetical protein